MKAVIYVMSDKVGEIRLEDGVLTPDPPRNGHLAEVLRQPLCTPDPIDQSDPERWLRNLPLQYRNPYLWAAFDEN